MYYLTQSFHLTLGLLLPFILLISITIHTAWAWVNQNNCKNCKGYREIWLRRQRLSNVNYRLFTNSNHSKQNLHLHCSYFWPILSYIYPYIRVGQELLHTCFLHTLNLFFFPFMRAFSPSPVFIPCRTLLSTSALTWPSLLNYTSDQLNSSPTSSSPPFKMISHIDIPSLSKTEVYFYLHLQDFQHPPPM